MFEINSFMTPTMVLTVPEIAEQLQISESTVYKLLRSEAIKGIKIGAVWRATPEAIKQYLENSWTWISLYFNLFNYIDWI